VADRPDGVADSPVSYGPNLQSWCVYLMVVHAIPVQRCGWSPAPRCIPGTTSATGIWPRSKTSAWVSCPAWSSTTATATTTGRCSPGWSTNCAPPILRDLEDARQCYPHAHWPIQIADALRDLIHAANTARDAGRPAIDDQLRDTRLEWIRAGVAVGLSEVDRNPDPKGKQPPGRCLLEMLRDRLGDVVRFAYDLKVPPTSNQAEPDVGPAKTQQRISGRLTSQAVTRARYRIRGYLSTAAKHGIDQLAALRNAVLGRPWTPAPTAPA